MYFGDENNILKQAIKALEKETGIRLYVIDFEQAIVNNESKLQLDAVVGIKGYEQLRFAVEVKQWAQQANFGAIVERMKRLPMKGIFVADYVNPNMAERLKEEEIQFIDTAGNAYVYAEPLFIYIKGNKNKYEVIKKKEKRRAFTTTGLKVIYAFLCEPGLVKAAYREIADKADVALGTVAWVVGDLKDIGYLIDRGGKKNRRINNYEDLLDKWVEMYPCTLRPKQLIGEFRREAPLNHHQIDIRKYEGYWGGENAGEKYTKYLKPEIDTVYIPEHFNSEFIHNFKLYKDKEKKGRKVRLYRPFWKRPGTYDGYVHPILAYTDLIATGDPRNIETARMIKDEYIEPLWKG